MTDWLTDGRMDWLTDWQMDGQTDGGADGLIDFLTFWGLASSMQNDVIKEDKAFGTRADTNNKIWFAISDLDLNSDSLITLRNLKTK